MTEDELTKAAVKNGLSQFNDDALKRLADWDGPILLDGDITNGRTGGWALY